MKTAAFFSSRTWTELVRSVIGEGIYSLLCCLALMTLNMLYGLGRVVSQNYSFDVVNHKTGLPGEDRIELLINRFVLFILWSLL